ncbi:polysaccharide deacetylase family protein [Deinococcus metallilatus]|uniref:Peptidoglycan/xylan/chitin deacetylase (PgdA/CDA1 family) n=1 Tax=Deinococcus metallilatus TaxID=1211322 RepID=A0AAJ5F352_9DEIO|nr:polysaccharide deacetylase family protein [Deinococcus metallilatus]MBB5294187.1 peptidoglycan/xylan/chitin deacetylase (PgdA/CDA1 family) [Deinococcus metallilatus]QBY08966.1 polysaccharide deacetylase family protein [Deinococcus metallilatus]RXJ10110.1 polysaccharide deacetylase family protein [Deinococcus metallilatus]TLK27953.1 polysaccharide deacetylase family protein [Deinococcus metallilatus]GMA16476.1 polysaccharide deacetylase familiy protein [Deinococcus metallilatus]
MRPSLKRGAWLGAGLLTLYVVLPYLLTQRLNLGLVREGKQRRKALALTFDDGPDPATTPAVLDALRGAGARATFFVIADRAEAHPDLIRRMLEEGHQVEAHAARHVHAWLRTPWGAFLDPLRAARRVAAVTGRPVRLHRPPHGAYTLATRLGQRAAGVTGAHWSVEGRDWHPAFTPEGVRQRVNELAFPGAVVVLHDAGPGARNTGPMLPGLLADLRERDYALVPLGELEGAAPLTLRELPRRLMRGLDRVFDRLGGTRPAGGRADNLFRVGPVSFPLAGVTLGGGTPIQKGTPAAEFHVNNPLLVDLGLRRSLRLAREDFRDLARDLQTRPDLQDAQVVFCLSALSPLLATLGFETQSLSPADTRRLRAWASVLRRAYGSDPHAPEPKLSVMGREAFVARYGAR